MNNLTRGAENTYGVHRPITMSAGEVHLWLVTDITILTDELTREFLTETELQRSQELADKPAQRYCATRAILRAFLSSYINVPPKLVTLNRGKYGKPYADPSQAGDLMFNLSDTGNIALYGFSRAGEIGVDVERCDRRANIDRVARRAMSHDELEQFTSLSADRKRDAFFTTWTRKEAYLKSIGTGLIIPMRSATIHGESPCPVIYPDTPPEAAKGQDWWVSDIRCFAGYYGAYGLPVIPPEPCTYTISATDLLQTVHVHSQ